MQVNSGELKAVPGFETGQEQALQTLLSYHLAPYTFQALLGRTNRPDQLRKTCSLETASADAWFACLIDRVADFDPFPGRSLELFRAMESPRNVRGRLERVKRLSSWRMRSCVV